MFCYIAYRCSICGSFVILQTSTRLSIITADILQFGTNSIIVLMFVESQRVTYRAPVRYVTNTWSVVLLNKKDIHCYLKCIVYDKLLNPRQSFRITLYLLQLTQDINIVSQTEGGT